MVNNFTPYRLHTWTLDFGHFCVHFRRSGKATQYVKEAPTRTGCAVEVHRVPAPPFVMTKAFAMRLPAPLSDKQLACMRRYGLSQCEEFAIDTRDSAVTIFAAIMGDPFR